MAVHALYHRITAALRNLNTDRQFERIGRELGGVDEDIDEGELVGGPSHRD
ncbi:MAG: hypothetical protein ACREJ4_02535 [Candidatus Methylomirabilaceae bacterium]